MKVKEKLGIDIGKVIIDGGRNDNSDTSFFGDRYLETTEVPGAIFTIAELAARRFKGNVFLVSKAGKRTALRSMQWLVHRRFFEITRIRPGQIHFCATRQEKAPICEELGITHFVDDRLEVLSYLTTVSNKFLFNPDEREVQRNLRHLDEVTRVNDWQEIKQLLLF